MKQQSLFPSTIREAPQGAESINHQLLVRGGYIDQLMAGSWTLLPLGFRVVEKINAIIREEMNKTGAQEVLMPLLHPKTIWNETGRWETAREVMYQFKDSRSKEYALSFTHEEILLDLIRKHLRTYKDLPVALYHFSTKFRNEARARSGILRGREFMMKDLYSLHATEEDFLKYYKLVKEAYLTIFKRLGFEIRVIEASGGVFTENRTHEFQVISDGGEDTIYYCDRCDWGENKEIFSGKIGGVCPRCGKGTIATSSSIEVGNIFPFGTYYSEKMKVRFTDDHGNQTYPYFGSYGIGSTRVMGALVETSHDDRGIIWHPNVSPFTCHLLKIGEADKAEQVYQKLQSAGVDVLYDDRDVGAGEKFADADLIGIPVRLVVSEKTKNVVEWKLRNTEKSAMLTISSVIDRLKKFQ